MATSVLSILILCIVYICSFWLNTWVGKTKEFIFWHEIDEYCHDAEKLMLFLPNTCFQMLHRTQLVPFWACNLNLVVACLPFLWQHLAYTSEYDAFRQKNNNCDSKNVCPPELIESFAFTVTKKICTYGPFHYSVAEDQELFILPAPVWRHAR